MTILRKTLLAGAFIATSIAQAGSMNGFDVTTLNPYIKQAEEALNQGLANAHYRISTEEVATQNYEKLIYTYQKAALKTICKELKRAAKDLKKSDKSLWLPARQLYKAFKHDVYKNWKKTQLLPAQQATVIV